MYLGMLLTDHPMGYYSSINKSLKYQYRLYLGWTSGTTPSEKATPSEVICSLLYFYETFKTNKFIGTKRVIVVRDWVVEGGKGSTWVSLEATNKFSNLPQEMTARFLWIYWTLQICRLDDFRVQYENVPEMNRNNCRETKWNSQWNTTHSYQRNPAAADLPWRPWQQRTHLYPSQGKARDPGAPKWWILPTYLC